MLREENSSGELRDRMSGICDRPEDNKRSQNKKPRWGGEKCWSEQEGHSSRSWWARGCRSELETLHPHCVTVSSSLLGISSMSRAPVTCLRPEHFGAHRPDCRHLYFMSLCSCRAFFSVQSLLRSHLHRGDGKCRGKLFLKYKWWELAC